MEQGKVFLRVDYGIQIVMILAICIIGLMSIMNTGEALFLALFWLFFVGVWQVLSAIILIAIRRDRIRMNYIGIVAAYLFIIIAGSSLFIQQGWTNYPLTILCWIIIPLGMAVWYFLQTRKDLHRIDPSQTADAHQAEGILDSDFNQ